MKQKQISLYYHSIANYPLSVPVNTFARQIHFLKNLGYEGNCIKDIDTDSIQNKQVFVTCDDCFTSVYDNAFPVLRENNCKATFYATIDYIGKQGWGSVKYQGWSDEKTDEFNIPFDYMNWDQLKELVDSGMEVGSHTITHRNLTELSKVEQEDEIFGSKEIIEKKLGIEVTSFCYPGGKFNDETTNIVKQAGYKYACTTIPGVITSESDPYKLNRHPYGGFDVYFKSLFLPQYRILFNLKKFIRAAVTT